MFTIALLMFSPLYFLSAGHMDWQEQLRKTAPDGAVDFTLHYVEMVRAHKFDDILKDSELKAPDKAADNNDKPTDNTAPDKTPAKTVPDKTPEELLRDAADFFPKGEPRSIKLVGVNFLTVPGEETKYQLLYEYQFDHAWIGVETLIRHPGAYVLTGLTVRELPDSVEHVNRLTFEHKGHVHYMMLALAVVMLLFDLVVFIRCMMLRGLKNKVIWCLFILVGILQVSFNWTTGHISWLSSYDTQSTMYNFFYIGLPIVQFFQIPYGPLVIRFSLPLGALMFVSRYPLSRK